MEKGPKSSLIIPPSAPYSKEAQEVRTEVNRVVRTKSVQSVLDSLERLQKSDPGAAMALLEGIDNALRGDTRGNWPLPLRGLSQGELIELKNATMKPGLARFESNDADPMAS